MKGLALQLFAFFMAITYGCLQSIEVFSQEMSDYSGPVFPSNHALNTPIDELPVHPNSANFIKTIGNTTSLHPDFGTSWNDEGEVRQMGIPYNVVGANQPLVPITFVSYPDESDPGPWPIPQNPYIETVFDWRDLDAGDRHMLIVDSDNHILYETGNVYGNSNGTEWEGGCGAVFDLNSNDLRPAKWTSADAAGLPIFPLLIRYDEVDRALASEGELSHAIRFTCVKTQRAFLWPARHYASSSSNPDYPPMGLRVRLKAETDISGFSPRMQVILRTMKKYGMIVADNGSNWYFQGTHDDRWDPEDINNLKRLHGSDFEVVDISEWMNRPGFNINSAAVPSGPVSYDLHSQNQDVLYQNYPNPFKNFTLISFSLSNIEHVIIRIMDCTGREICTLVNEEKAPGLHTVEWTGKNSSGQKVNAGLYFYQFQLANGLARTMKLLFY